MEPTAQCWSNKGEVYVGCKDGQLFRVDCDSGLSTLVLGGSTGKRSGASRKMKKNFFLNLNWFVMNV